ncbi:hypothetical protein H0H93_004666 [Arthromyces matolae]|nr:hypothetical protein H0H93_004666 [Arthromyces matolae]
MHIAAAGKALQELTILLGSDGDLTPLTNAINMHATNLRSFRMDAYDVERAVQILSLLDGKRALQDLTISLLMDKGDVERGPWDKLQDILINQDRFTALECLELSFIPDSSRIPFSTATVLAALPELVRKKILYVTTTGYNA